MEGRGHTSCLMLIECFTGFMTEIEKYSDRKQRMVPFIFVSDGNHLATYSMKGKKKIFGENEIHKQSGLKTLAKSEASILY